MVHSAVQPAAVTSSLSHMIFQVFPFFLMVARMYGYGFSAAGT
jgi:hypothetical protein